MTVGDAGQKGGVDVFEFRTTILGQSLKNVASQRSIPIHSHLLSLGFKEYVRARKATGAVWLFEKRSPPESTKGAGAKLSQHWTTTRTKKIAGLTPAATFHSFRNLVVQELMEHRIDGYLISQIVGHTDTSITTGGYGKPVDVKQHREIMELLDFSNEVDAIKSLTSR